MIDFKVSGIDEFIDDLNSLEFEIECPKCNHPVKISSDSIGGSVTCPNCNTDIKIESK